MNKILNIASLLILSIAASCGSCNDNNAKSKIVELKNDMTLKEKILNIEEEVIDLTSSSSLFKSKLFIEVYENPSNYVSDAINLMSDTSITEQQKFIVIYSMQNLEINEYKEILKNCATFYEYGIFSEQHIKTIISSGFGKKYPVLKNYKDKEVKEILRKIQSCENTSPEFSTYIDNIIKGKAWKELKSFIRNSGM